MKKNIFSTCLLIIGSSCTVLLSGCSKFLDEQDPSNFTTGTYFTKPQHAQAVVDATYASMRDPMESGFGGGAWTMVEFATGQSGTDLGQAVDSYYVKDLKNTSDNGYGQTIWTAYYRGIANANLAITKIPGIDMDKTQAQKLMGEAYFLRAWYYFQLVRLFGNIPLVTKVVDLQSDQLKPAPANPEDVYKQIVDDLKNAESAGLPWTDPSGRVSLGAVKSLLSSVYLTMAGYPLQKGAPYYTLAADKAKEVINANQFTLFTSYNDLHNPAKKNTGENIFMIQYKTQVIPSNWQVLIIPYNKNISAYSSETGGIYPTLSFVRSYDPADLRTKEKQFFFTKFTNENDRSVVVDLGGYFPYKLFDSVAQTSTASSDLNWPLLRYAEVLFIYAEASNEVNGPTTDAYKAVNDIRQRAQLPPLSGLSKEQFREAVWKEKGYELCFENKTWFDMVRTRKAFNESTQTFDDYVGHKFSYGPVLSERELLFPIPTAEVRNNPHLKQNTGY